MTGGFRDPSSQPHRRRWTLVDELRLGFTHTKAMSWFLPNVPPTLRKVVVDVVVIVQFRGGKVACERIYWDHANVLRQVGLLDAMAQRQHDDKEKKE